jgi:16S rRNA processing protein RimM
MDVETDFPERLRAGATVFVGRARKPAVIESARLVPGGMLLKLDEVDTAETAAQYRNETVYVASGNRPALPKGTFYHHEVIGSRVVDDEEQPVGRVSEILVTGANDVYVVKTVSGGELLLPAIDSVILEVDPPRKLIRVHVPEFFEAQADG